MANMQTGNTCFSVSVICLWLVISGALAKAVENVEGNATASEKPIRLSQSLCAGEQEYVHKRKQVVLESLNSLGINCTADSVPHIALLASGGGQRAAVSLIGSLYQMEKEGLLDTLLYLGGVSGSTWSMSFLYSDPQWSTNMDRAVSRLSGPGVSLDEALAWVGARAKEEHFSLSDIWGVLTSVGLMKQMDPRPFSDEASRNSTNPYPIYSAIEKQCYSNGTIDGKWFEMSPHEAGFTELGLFLETSLLGSKFQSGELLERKPEKDMIRVQGVLSCAFAHEEIVLRFIPDWLDVPGHGGAAVKYMRRYNSLDVLFDLLRSIIKEPATRSDLERLDKLLEDKVNHNRSAFLECQSLEERSSTFTKWSLELLKEVETWSQTLEDGEFKTFVEQIIPLLRKWEWGTTRNFLYQYQDSTVPPCLHSRESFHLVDAGLLINTAFPPFLGDKRDVDLIITLETSAGNMFETLTLARDYAAEVKKPFPEIDDKILEERDWPKDCYVFEGKEKEPSVVYMPLFNRRNCKDAEELKAKMVEFATFQLPYSQEKIEFVLETAKANVKNNKETLLREVDKAVLRRRRRAEAGAAPEL